MMTAPQATSDSFRAFVQRVRSIEISTLVYQLEQSPFSRAWMEAQIRKNITHYFAFLYLVDRYPNLKLVPTQEIDHVWNCHILDTEKYAADCQILFNQFIHHAPLAGRSGSANTNQATQNHHASEQSAVHRSDRIAAAVLTQVLFRKHFGCTMEGFSPVPAHWESLLSQSTVQQMYLNPELDFSLFVFMPESL